MENITVLGAGSWGTSIATILADNGLEVKLWVYEKELVDMIKAKRENPIYLPGIPLSEKIIPLGDIGEACRNTNIIISVIPSQYVRSVLNQAKEFVEPDTIFVSASKGIENKTLLTISQIFSQVFAERNDIRVTVLGGPTFAREVSKKLPTVTVLATQDVLIGKSIQKILSNKYFRVYTNHDLIGVELGGAIKNVIAIAAGIIAGLECGHNTLAALITRGIAEMSRLGVAMGAKLLTFAGLAGIGDLVLTCTGDLSRNRSVGIKIAKGMKLEEILKDMKMVAEGIKTAESVVGVAKKYDVEMPICEKVYEILFKNKEPRQAISDLMERDLKSEFRGDPI